MVAGTPTFGELDETVAISRVLSALEDAKVAAHRFGPWSDAAPSDAKVRKTSGAAPVAATLTSGELTAYTPVPTRAAGSLKPTSNVNAGAGVSNAAASENGSTQYETGGNQAGSGSTSPGTDIALLLGRIRDLAAICYTGVSKEYALEELDGMLAQFVRGPQRRLFPMKYVLRKVEDTLFQLYKAKQCDPWEHYVTRLLRETQEFSD